MDLSNRIIIIIIIIIIIKMFNRHILALKMNYNVFTRFGKLQKPNWDWVYKIKIVIEQMVTNVIKTISLLR